MEAVRLPNRHLRKSPPRIIPLDHVGIPQEDEHNSHVGHEKPADRFEYRTRETGILASPPRGYAML